MSYPESVECRRYTRSLWSWAETPSKALCAIGQLNGPAVEDSAFSRRWKPIGTDARAVPRASLIRRAVYEAVPVALHVFDVRVREVTGHYKSSVFQAAQEGFTSQHVRQFFAG